MRLQAATATTTNRGLKNGLISCTKLALELYILVQCLVVFCQIVGAVVKTQRNLLPKAVKLAVKNFLGLRHLHLKVPFGPSNVIITENYLTTKPGRGKISEFSLCTVASPAVVFRLVLALLPRSCTLLAQVFYLVPSIWREKKTVAIKTAMKRPGNRSDKVKNLC